MGVRGTVGALAVAMALTGCTSDEPPPTTLPPLSLPSASTAASTQVPDLPADARGTTPEAASAFVTFYLNQVNAAYGSRDAMRIRPFHQATCQACRNIVDDIERLVRQDNRVSGSRFRLETVVTAPALPDGSFIVDFRFSSDPYVERDAAGAVLRQEPAQIDQDSQMRVRRSDTTWLIDGIRNVDA